LTHFSVDDFGLVMSFGLSFVFLYVLDRFVFTAVFFFSFQICLFLPAMMQIGDQPLKISDVIIA
jgi:hypothetical protein